MKKYSLTINIKNPDHNGSSTVPPPIDPIITGEIQRRPPNGNLAKKYHKLTLQCMLRKLGKKPKISKGRGGKQSKKYLVKKGNKVWSTSKR